MKIRDAEVTLDDLVDFNFGPDLCGTAGARYQQLLRLNRPMPGIGLDARRARGLCTDPRSDEAGEFLRQAERSGCFTLAFCHCWRLACDGDGRDIRAFHERIEQARGEWWHLDRQALADRLLDPLATMWHEIAGFARRSGGEGTALRR